MLKYNFLKRYNPVKNILFKKYLLFIVFILLSGFNHTLLANTAVQIDTVLTDKLSEDNPGEPKDVFKPDTSKIYVIWKSDQLKEGQSIKSVWIADDTHNVVPANYKIDEATFDLNKSFKEKMMSVLPGNYWHGNFSLSKPNAGWPVGKYHVDIYVDNQLVKTIPFTIASEQTKSVSSNQTQWGSIAIDQVAGDTDPAYGYGVADTKEASEKIAHDYCVEAEGKNCKIVLNYQECGAYAVSSNSNGVGIGSTKKAAKDEAIKNCKSNDCKIVVVDCNNS